jgi:hypothetical protein
MFQTFAGKKLVSSKGERWRNEMRYYGGIDGERSDPRSAGAARAAANLHISGKIQPGALDQTSCALFNLLETLLEPTA